MQLRHALVTHIGLRRLQNQDNAVARPELGLFVVADGMGGHSGGEIASSLAIEGILKKVCEKETQPIWNPKDLIREAVLTANQMIYDYTLEHPELQGMGTTAVSLLFAEKLLAISNVGDSRCYFARPESFWQLTRDHSLVQEKVRAGLITREQLKLDRNKNIITRSVGFEPNLLVDVYEMAVQPGDLFLLCSDGLSGQVEDSEIHAILQKEFFKGGGLKKTAESLVEAANNKGGDDNVTVLLVETAEGERDV